MIGKRAATVSEPLIGYRHWRERDHRLASSFLPGHPWHEATMRARCDRHFAFRLLPHLRGIPGGKCRCGLYAFHRPPVAPDDITSATSGRPVPTFYHERSAEHNIAGAVIAWGRIQVQEPSILSKSYQPEAWERMRFLARRYSVPILATADLVAYAAEHGSPAPPELRGVA